MYLSTREKSRKERIIKKYEDALLQYKEDRQKRSRIWKSYLESIEEYNHFNYMKSLESRAMEDLLSRTKYKDDLDTYTLIKECLRNREYSEDMCYKFCKEKDVFQKLSQFHRDYICVKLSAGDLGEAEEALRYAKQQNARPFYLLEGASQQIKRKKEEKALSSGFKTPRNRDFDQTVYLLNDTIQSFPEQKEFLIETFTKDTGLDSPTNNLDLKSPFSKKNSNIHSSKMSKNIKSTRRQRRDRALGEIIVPRGATTIEEETIGGTCRIEHTIPLFSSDTIASKALYRAENKDKLSDISEKGSSKENETPLNSSPETMVCKFTDSESPKKPRRRLFHRHIALNSNLNSNTKQKRVQFSSIYKNTLPKPRLKGSYVEPRNLEGVFKYS
eukprot:maker-scaffold_12-snap-gene-0.56-mRNA-1 protein AED:0.00 eAED:0.00 QI:84/1/1/1/1/1/2/306/385